MNLFDKLVIKKEIDGVYEYECPKGLWGVSGKHKPSVSTEAQHYFWQYMEDGEYEDLINEHV